LSIGTAAGTVFASMVARFVVANDGGHAESD
jgi:hypothetical protein